MEQDGQALLHAALGGMRRRRFLGLAGGTMGATILAACGGTGTVTDTPRPATAVATAPAVTTTASSAPAIASPVRTMTTSGSTAVGATSTSGIQTMVIEAFDYGFRTLGSIPGGPTRVQMKNTGTEDHHAQFLLLNPGVSLEQVAAALQKGSDGADALVTYAGGPGGVPAGGSAEVILDLKEGQYLIACFLRGADHLPHFAKGMRMPLTVTAPTVATLPTPVVNGAITLFDFNFTMPDALPAGRSMYTVTNTGAQYHEFAVGRLLPGKTADDFKVFFDPAARGGPPPGIAVGGMQALTRGNTGIVVLDLAPGNYVALCSVPDQSKPQGESARPPRHGEGFQRSMTAGRAKRVRYNPRDDTSLQDVLVHDCHGLWEVPR